MKYLLSLAVLLATSILVSTASAGGSKPPAGCIQWNKITKVCKRFVQSPPVYPVAHPTTPPNGTTTPPSGGNPPPNGNPQPAPAPNPNLPVESFCVQTVERGETFVQANPGAFDPGGAWYDLTVSGATVTLDHHAVTLLWEDGKGVILAAKVPAPIGLTCGQPYVSTNGDYQDKNFGLRGAAWDAAFPNG